jgi:hypothetical protein
MRQIMYFGLIIFALVFFAGCGKQKKKQTPQSLTKENANYTADLTGTNEVPDTVSTLAKGVAIFKLSGDGTKLQYKLTVSDIDSVTMAHIHKGSADENGPILVWLYPVAGPPPQVMPGPVNGIIAEGQITTAKLNGPLSGKKVADLKKLMDEDSTYVQVHTKKYPEGQIRGQIK